MQPDALTTVTVRPGDQPGDRELVAAMTDSRARRWTGGLDDCFGPVPATDPYDSPRPFLVLSGDEPAGAVVAERASGGVVLAILIAPPFRRAGLGQHALDLVMSEEEFEGSAFSCEVSAAHRMVEAAGFEESFRDDDVVSYQKASANAEALLDWSWSWARSSVSAARARRQRGADG